MIDLKNIRESCMMNYKCTTMAQTSSGQVHRRTAIGTMTGRQILYLKPIYSSLGSLVLIVSLMILFSSSLSSKALSTLSLYHSI